MDHTAIDSRLESARRAAEAALPASADLVTKMQATRDAYAGVHTDLQTRARTSPASEAREQRAVADYVATQLVEVDERISELTEQEARAESGAQARASHFEPVQEAPRSRSVYSELLTRSAADHSPVYTSPQAPTYGRHNMHEVSFFRDVAAARRGDFDALDRLNRNAQERAAETRAGDLSTGAGAGGQFAPPLWVVEDYIALARASRVTANVLTHQDLPPGISSVNIPKVATGTTTAVQTAQNTALSDTAATTSAVSAAISTIGGKQIVSLQLMSQSGIPFDQVVLGDLAADTARTLDQQVINGSGASGQLTGLITSGTALTYTQASPTIATLQKAVMQAVNQINTQRFLPPNILVLHPTFWSWILEAVDSQGRPLVVPDATANTAVNAYGTASALGAEGIVGKFAGLPVAIDPNLPTNLGAGTNQSVALVMRTADVWFYESEPRLESFDATYADQMSILFRAYQYAVSPLVRYAPSVQVIGGTGMVMPSL